MYRAALIFIFVSMNALADDWYPLEPEDNIVSTLKSGNDSDWVRFGTVDVDGDSDQDVLVAHDYLTKDADENGEAAFLLFINRGGDFYFSKDIGPLIIQFDDLEFRKIKPSSGNRVFVNYRKIDGAYRAFSAVWVESSNEGSVKVRYGKYSTEYLVPPEENDVVLQKSADGSRAGGLSIGEVLNGYMRMTAEEALEHFGPEGSKIIEE